MKVNVFNNEGELVGPIKTKKVTRTDEQWQEQLTADQYRILRNKGTEPAFTGELLKNKNAGVYTCAGCGLPLFDSETKFDSGTGWPSFYKPIAEQNIAEITDNSHGMTRTEILCQRCDGHLGHVFNDGPRPTGLRYCLNSASLGFTPQAQLKELADPATQQAVAVLAGGCFWCTEAVFEPVKGVIDVESGYAGGSAETANYTAVSGGSTDHAEAIRITYNPSEVSYEELLKLFFTIAHDPTQLNRQGNDMGRQYRSAVFYADDAEKQAAEKFIAALEAEGKFDKPIVTTLEPLTTFYVAEKYHQDYAQQNPDQPYIRAVAAPKVEKLKTKHPEKLKGSE